ncbi:glycosyl transferase, group 1 family protein [Trichomonas vaginalis G3]|uniref:Glycosyl transferase, group 1 family protein n=1 Tax=Trichomonas vaginalis (strain ATCC PRA-98 / G3) TaxID=412133 RepID=A2G6B1_TRIV3|nr:glycosyl transferase [Trichomonas vaginalis G3]EAX87302.1 glycosyl transferase, group 1 family protein [Trichomonas vaginalis G3]KAI5548398.1 chitobiosyldiphosphodolichol beta-mannosyltransferase protein [Trichomonas vaginalis G3]|eukprot:XP_001300232.1 glycosyl transferase [Trichomonas vaginalis G3]
MPEYVVVVLGDLGRSPRMQNHAVCLSKLPNARVHLVGYNESPLFKELQESKNVVIHPIKPFWNLPRILFPIYAPLKILWLFFQLFLLIFTLPRFELVLAQNPPTIPTLPFCWLLRVIKGKRFVIDWHNLGWSILQCNKSRGWKVLKFLEYITGRWSDGNITVTNALQAHLREHKIESAVVYDKPSNLFKPTRELRSKYAKQLNLEENSIWIMSSTSWTPDEDIDMINRTAEILDKELGEKKKNITFIISGKGPNQRAFIQEVKGRNYMNIDFCYPFLPYEQYAELLGSCDAGVSLHKSSSGFDLPMKGLDMIGAGLPLLSVRYSCIDELVHEGVDGLLFNDEQELANIIRSCFIEKTIDIEKIRKGSIEAGAEKWAGLWERAAKPVLIV